MARNAKTSATRKSNVTVQPKGVNDAGSSKEIADKTSRLYKTAATASRGDLGSGDPALWKR